MRVLIHGHSLPGLVFGDAQSGNCYQNVHIAIQSRDTAAQVVPADSESVHFMAEATPVHEAAQLQKDLERAGIHPFAWVVNQCLTPLAVTDPVLVQRRAREARYLGEIERLSTRMVLIPWSADR